MNMYRTPIVTGDRVAIAPHHDLWMAGCRYGTVTSVNTEHGFYFVDLDTGRNVTLNKDDLLGAVAGTPVGGASPSTQAALTEQTFEDYLSDEPDQHGLPDGMSREEYNDLRGSLQGWGQ